MNAIPKKELTSVAEKAKTTIEVLAANMVNLQTINKIFFRNYLGVDLESTIKLLYRGRKLYDARERACTILKSVLEIEVSIQQGGTIWRILQEQSNDTLHEKHKSLIDNLVMLIGRALNLIDSFKEEHKQF